MTVFTKSLAALLVLLFTYIDSNAQWCTPVVTQNFSHGILRFTVNGSPSIDRSSSPDELYVFTGMSTTLRRGATYNVTFTQNYGSFCSLTNLLIWIDFNKDFDFEDSGENVVSISNTPGSQHQATFTVPLDAVLYSTRMRVASKMTQSCGHTLPTPCNIPPDPLGWHGEFEDYTALIVNPTGVTPVSSETPTKFELAQNYPNPFNPATKIRFSVPVNNENVGGSFVTLTIFNALGKKVETLVNEKQNAGIYEISWDGANYPSGVYYYRLESAGSSFDQKQIFSETRKMVLLK